MTRAQIEKAVRVWQSRLKLDHWDIQIEWNKPAAEGYVAECWAEDQYDIAKLRISPKHGEWKVPYGTQAVIHELMHLHERDVEKAVKAAKPLLGLPAYELFWARYDHEREGLVDRLATILYELGR